MTARGVAQASLPPLCHAEHPETGGIILIRRGEPGYRPVATDMSADVLNAVLDPVPTSLQIEAMLVGSMFGWDVPGADPEVLRARRGGAS